MLQGGVPRCRILLRSCPPSDVVLPKIPLQSSDLARCVVLKADRASIKPIDEAVRGNRNQEILRTPALHHQLSFLFVQAELKARAEEIITEFVVSYCGAELLAWD